jgi:predicted Zn-dependent peptidase
MAQGVTDDELVQAKNKVLARSVLRSERPMGRLASLGFNWMYRRQYLSIEDELAAFSKVTREDLSRVLADWPLWPMTIVSVGPTTEIQPPKEA